MSEKQRTAGLLALLGVLVIVAVVRLWPSSPPPPPANSLNAGVGAARAGGGSSAAARARAQQARRSVGTSSRSRSGGSTEILELRVADLEKKPGEFSTGRNPFRYAPKVAQRPEPKPVAQRPKPKVQPRAEAEPRRAPKPQPPKFTAKYIGSFGPKMAPIAVFTQGDEILNAREGDVVLKKWVVAKIGYETVDVGFTEFPEAKPQRLAVGR